MVYEASDEELNNWFSEAQELLNCNLERNIVTMVKEALSINTEYMGYTFGPVEFFSDAGTTCCFAVTNSQCCQSVPTPSLVFE